MGSAVDVTLGMGTRYRGHTGNGEWARGKVTGSAVEVKPGTRSGHGDQLWDQLWMSHQAWGPVMGPSLDVTPSMANEHGVQL